MSRSNVASRLFRVVQKASETGDGPVSADAWAMIFELPEEERDDRDFKVASCLGIMRSQLRLMKEGLLAKSIPADIWADCVTNVGNALNARNLGAKWGLVTQHLRPEALSVLRALPEFLDHDGPELEEADRHKALSELDSLVLGYDSAGLPPEIIDFLMSQVNLARRAMWEYPLRGPAAVAEASDAAARDWIVHAEIIAPYRTNPSVVGTYDIWPGFEKWGKRAVLIGALAKLVFMTVPDLIDRARHLPELPTPVHCAPISVSSMSSLPGEPHKDAPPKTTP